MGKHIKGNVGFATFCASLALAPQGFAFQASFVLSYFLNPDGNQIAVNSETPIQFPPTNVNTTSSATFMIHNAGLAAATVNAVGITGAAFAISGLPLLPAPVAPNGDLRFTLSFSPKSRGAFTGSLRLTLSMSEYTIPVQGQAIGPSLLYTATIGNQTFSLTTNTGLTFPNLALGSKVIATITVQNQGDASATINNVTTVGAAYSLANLPPLPVTIASNALLVFQVYFTPQVAGPANGSLLLDNIAIPLNGLGIGPMLQYASVNGSVRTVLTDGGTIVFPNTDIGAKTSLTIVVTNTGNAAATVNSISTSGSFFIPALPQLPVTIPPDGAVQFTISFAASSAGVVNGMLLIDTFSVNLKGVGNTPPTLSSASITGLAESVSPLTQPSVGISLNQPYPLTITGSLTLSFLPDSFSDDPNIQFASGGRTVAFTIPANTTDALFNGSPRIQFQSGTVAGVITLTATFASGSVDITPAPTPKQTVLVVAGPPQLRNVQLGAVSAASFELLITGYSTTRSVSTLNLRFVAASKANLQTSSLSVNTEAPFTTWFQSPSGSSFGSQFTASVIVNVNGDITAVQSVSVVASNSRGDSNALAVSLR